MNHQALIAIGSNLGDRFKNICEAVRLMEEHPLVKIGRLSHFYETEPLTLKNQKQNWYLNCVVKVKTSLNPIRFFQLLQNIENMLGRVRTQKWAARTIDLDLLFFDDEIIRTDSLTLPHPQLHLRRFVLEPLLEIAPDYIHPVKGASIKALHHKLRDNKTVVPLYKFSLSHSSEGVLKTPLRERL
jgi:2-amino-4-hydroxy-6-hydroxymethyldihydropteridine diphosphokinase